MFIAMNRFQVKTGSEQAFETVWRTRESYLSNMAGFVEFHLLKGPVADDHTLYSSHTTWVDKAAFEAWTRSEEFRRAHARADNKTGESLYLGHPKFEGFEVIQSERKSSAASDGVSHHHLIVDRLVDVVRQHRERFGDARADRAWGRQEY